MKKSVKIRKIIFEILYEIYKRNNNFEEGYKNKTKSTSLNYQETSMIYNIVLNSMRYNLFIIEILKKYLKKKTSNKVKILLVSAITQILYLDFKDYAVTNDTVEVAKIKKLNPGLINSLLKNLIKNKNSINKREIEKQSIPIWFSKALGKLKININSFFENICQEPSLHIVFKNKKYFKNFKEDHFKTTDISAFIKTRKQIPNIANFHEGHWWVQDFASMLPIYLCPELKFKNILDMCSAPGGKAFQLISLTNTVNLNDISLKRIKILKDNLNRLNFKCKITNYNALNILENIKFDVVILDSPCSGVGTIRRNPEILFKKNSPNFNLLIKNQEKLINKASKLLKKNGVLIYMVCSFLYEETKDIKIKFLKNNKNFSQYYFNLKNHNKLKHFIDKDGDFFCIPNNYNGYMIDGFYSVKFIRHD
tara:strand:+ start:12502 stop:13767 length:1266 start_codon:yes stop_codon:yes gene_type:complete